MLEVETMLKKIFTLFLLWSSCSLLRPLSIYHLWCHDRSLMISVAFNTLSLFVIIYGRFKINRFMSKFCPRNVRSCIGVYKRNVITWKCTGWWALLWILWTYADVAYKVTLLQFQNWSTRSMFWVGSISKITFVECFHLILPLFFDVPGEGETINKARKFYVTK